MMFIIAGVSPKIKTLDANPRRCSVCGLHQGYLKRTDHYLSLFFVPILRVKKGKPFVLCDRCESSSLEFGHPGDNASDSPQQCGFCGYRLQRDYRFCPNCGKPL